MVIQRIQSVYLFIASVLMCIINFVVPISSLNGGEVDLYICPNVIELLVINLLAALLLFVGIFLFKNLPLQMKVTRISTVLIALSAAFEAYILSTQIEGEAKWIGSAIILVCSFVLSLLALKGMTKDYNLLKSYDRLR